MNGLIPALAASGSIIAGAMGMRRLVEAPPGLVATLRPPVLLERTERGRRLAVTLRRAGVTIPVDLVAAGVAAAALAVASLVWLLLRNPLVVVVAAAAVAAGAHAFVASAENRYLSRFSAQLPVVAQQLAGAIGAGLTLRQAIARTAEDAPEPARDELRAVSLELRFGTRLDAALETLAERVPDPGLRILVTAILVQRSVGGDLARALADLSARLEQRSALEREARAATAQARMSAWLVAGLPLAGGIFVEIAAPGTLARTLGQGPGLALLAVATAIEVIGVAAIRRIVRHQERV